MLVLDTDHVSALGRSSEVSLRLLERIDASRQDVATTIITVEEQLRGWLAEIHRLADVHQQILAYDHLRRAIDFFAAWTVLSWDSRAADLFVRFRREGVRIGSMDLKIASIALAYGGTLLTANTADFARVRGVKFVNWLE